MRLTHFYTQRRFVRSWRLSRQPKAPADSRYAITIGARCPKIVAGEGLGLKAVQAGVNQKASGRAAYGRAWAALTRKPCVLRNSSIMACMRSWRARPSTADVSRHDFAASSPRGGPTLDHQSTPMAAARMSTATSAPVESILGRSTSPAQLSRLLICDSPVPVSVWPYLDVKFD